MGDKIYAVDAKRGSKSVTTHAVRENNEDHDAIKPDGASIHSESSSVQAGVQKALILRAAWSKTTLFIAFSSLFVTTLIITFSHYAERVVDPYVVSDFKNHSAMSAARVASNIIGIIAFPVIAKFNDVLGRAEVFVFSILLQTICYVIYATSQNIGHYVVAGLFDSIGSTGFGLTQQVFIADATTLVNRAIWSTLPESITSIPALYLGSIIGQGFLENAGWRWSYGTWAIIVPIVAVPLVATMAILQRRAKRNGLVPKKLSDITGCTEETPMWRKIVQVLWAEFDFLGLTLLAAGLSLVLIPVSLSGSFNPGRWREASFIAMVVIGVVLLAAFLIWDLKFAKKPLIPARMANRTVIAACAIQVFDFLGYSLFTIFFPSYLQVAGQFGPAQAARIDNSLRVAFQICGLIVAIVMRYTRNTQIWILTGLPLVIIGQGLMIYLVDMGNGQHGTEVTFIVSKVLSGIGRAFFQTAGQVTVQAVVSRQDLATITALFQAGNSVGAAIGVSVAGAIWRNTLPDKLLQYLPEGEKQNATSIFQSMVVAKKYQPGTPNRDAIDRSYRESQRILAIVSTCMCVPNLIMMWFMKDIKLDKEDQKDQENMNRAIAKLEKKDDREMVQDDDRSNGVERK